jgi:hypothetical protein
MPMPGTHKKIQLTVGSERNKKGAGFAKQNKEVVTSQHT